MIFSFGLQIQVRSTSAIALLLALLYIDDFLAAKKGLRALPVYAEALASSRLSLPKALDELENYFIGEPDFPVLFPFSSPNSLFI